MPPGPALKLAGLSCSVLSSFLESWIISILAETAIQHITKSNLLEEKEVYFSTNDCITVDP